MIHFQLSLWEQKTVPENLPPPTDKYKLKYQQYEAEMKEGYKQYSQRAAEKKAKDNQQHKPPERIAEEKVTFILHLTLGTLLTFM